MVKILEVMKKERRPLYFNEIAGKTKISSKNNITKNLNALSKNGLLIKKPYKNSTYYCINNENYAVFMLFALIDEFYISNLPFEVRKIISEIREKINAKYMLIFGSYAKGDYGKKSDVDILIVGIENKGALKNVLRELETLYGKRIHLEVIDKIAKDHFGKEILSYAIPIKNQVNFYEENKDDIFKVLD
jgi:predicted nucleotidyltransferase